MSTDDKVFKGMLRLFHSLVPYTLGLSALISLVPVLWWWISSHITWKFMKLEGYKPLTEFVNKTSLKNVNFTYLSNQKDRVRFIQYH